MVRRNRNPFWARFYQPGLPMPMAVLPASLCEPDVLLPEQVRRGINLPAGPERRLLLAVLETALDDLGIGRGRQGPKSRNGSEAAVHAWVRGADAPFSFEFVCDALGLDAVSVRVRLLMAHFLASSSDTKPLTRCS